MRKGGLLFLAVAAAGLGVGALLAGGVRDAFQERLEELKRREVGLQGTLAALSARIEDDLRALDVLERYALAPLLDAMAFYAAVQQAPQARGVPILSMRWAGERTLVIALEGDYYGVVRTLADWQTLPVTLDALTLRPGAGGRVGAEVTPKAPAEGSGR